jgi:hypothetical protein
MAASCQSTALPTGRRRSWQPDRLFRGPGNARVGSHRPWRVRPTRARLNPYWAVEDLWCNAAADTFICPSSRATGPASRGRRPRAVLPGAGAGRCRSVLVGGPFPSAKLRPGARGFFRSPAGMKPADSAWQSDGNNVPRTGTVREGQGGTGRATPCQAMPPGRPVLAGTFP